VTSAIPLGTDYGMTLIMAEGYRPPPGEALVGSWRNVVTPGFFETMGARLTAGRLFDDRDTAGAPRSIVVDTRLARRFWPNQDPIGRTMHYPQRKDPYVVADRSAVLTVVGVVDELKARGALKAGGAIGAFYLPYAQAPAAGLTFAVRTVARPESIAAALRGAVQRVDPQIPLYDVQTMTERASGTLESQRLQAWVATGFGLVALALCAIGLYGVLAYLVVQRTREIAVRIALGSTQGGVFRLVLREGAVLIAAGFVLGLAGVAALGGYLQAYLFGVRASNPAVLLLVGAGLGAISVMACVLPARRAARINPVTALAEP
jgi:predicted permease